MVSAVAGVVLLIILIVVFKMVCTFRAYMLIRFDIFGFLLISKNVKVKVKDYFKEFARASEEICEFII